MNFISFPGKDRFFSKIFYHLAIFIFVFDLFYSNLSAETHKIGQIPPNILVPQIGSKKLFNLRKKINKKGFTLVSFSATWCAPCIQEINELKYLKQKYGNKLKIYLIFIDKQGNKVIRFKKKYSIPFIIGHDQFQFAATKYNVSKMPSTFLLNKKGVLIYKTLGYKKDNIQQIIKLVDS